MASLPKMPNQPIYGRMVSAEQWNGDMMFRRDLKRD